MSLAKSPGTPVAALIISRTLAESFSISIVSSTILLLTIELSCILFDVIVLFSICLVLIALSSNLSPEPYSCLNLR